MAAGSAPAQVQGGQEPPATTPPAHPAPPAEPVDPLGRDTPRGTLRGFFEAVEKNDYQRASDYLDLRYMLRRNPDLERPLLARQVNLVLQRALWVDVAAVSNSPDGTAADGLPAYRDEFGRIEFDGHTTQLLLERVADGDQTPAWLIARLISRPSSPRYRPIRRLLAGPVAWLIALTAGGMVILHLGVGQTGQRVAQAKTLTIIMTIWLLFSLLGLFSDILAERMRKRGRDAAVVPLRQVKTTIKIVIALGGLLIWLDNIGFDITTLLAGLGIGGLAIALALQKPLEDMFGALTLFTQQIIHVNDFCRVGSTFGTIEEIGLRTTRMRTLADTVVSLPNAKFAGEYIENITARQKIRYFTLVRLRNDTTAEQLQQMLEKTRVLLAEHPMIVEGSPRVRFKELAEYAHVVEVHGYVATTVYAEFLEVAEALNLGIVEAVAAAGASFALPMERVR